MVKYRNNLPQLSERLFLTDGGLETTLIFPARYLICQSLLLLICCRREFGLPDSLGLLSVLYRVGGAA